MRLPAFVWAAIAIFLLGAAQVVQGNWIVWTQNFTPLDVPLPLTPTIIEKEFVVDADYPHAIQVVVQRKLPFEQLTCSVGIPPLSHPEVCANYPNVIDAKWTVFNGEEVVASGTSKEAGGAWYSTDIGRELGEFRGKRGERYRLKVQFFKESSVLAPTTPCLQIQVPASYLKDVYVGTGMSWMIGEVCAGISLIVLLLGVVIRRLQRTRET